MSEFKNWRVAPMTPSRVDTPDGMISVSWRSNSDNGATDMKAERAARLIAAAPELLEALEELAAWVNRAIVPEYGLRKPMPENCRKALEASAAAIAKATGEQP